MVVKRLQRQSFVQPIGVVRANAGGELVGQAIANFATDRANEAFRKAGIRAERIGAEAAASLSSEAIVSIDPETNQPVRYTPPVGYGEIAAASYQNMIKSRFESSVQKEIQRKGTEFASSSGSAANYRDNMSSYIESMYNADGNATPYSRYITEYGQEYVESTYTTLAKKEAEAARKALITSEKVRLAEDELLIKRQIAAGEDPDVIRKFIQKQYIGYEGLLEVDGITATQYSAAIERTYGLNSMLGSNRLIDIYVGLSDSDKARFKIGLRKPEVLAQLAIEIGEDNLTAYAIGAKIDASIPSIISALRSYDEDVLSYEESQVEEGVADLTPNVQPFMTINGIKNLSSNIEDVDVRTAVNQELTATWITQNLDVAGKTAADIDVITNALRSDGGVDYNAIKELIGGEQGQAIVSELKSMSSEDRSDLADTLDDRQTSLNRIEDQGERDEENRLRRSISSLPKAMNVNSEYRSQRTIINKSSLDEVKKSTLLNLLDESYTEVLRNSSKDIQLSVSELQVVSDALEDPANANFDLFSPNAKKMYETLKVSNEKFPALTRGFVSARISASQNQNKRESNELRLSVIEASLDLVSPEDLEWYEETTLGDTVLIASEMMSNSIVSSSLRRGVVLPKVKDAMEAALNSLDEKQLTTALQIFDQYSNTTKTVNSTGELPLDIMRQSLSPSAYASYRAMVYAAAEQGIEPMAIALQLRNYDGNLDSDIKADLEIPKSADLNRVFEGINISPGYRQDILSMLRVRKALGASITEATVTNVIDGYTKKMREDSRVISPRVGDKSFYSRKQYFGQEEIIRNREQMLDLMEESGVYNHLLTGGTVIDQYAQVLNLMAGGELAQGARAIFEGLGAGDELLNRERVSDDVRTRQKKRIMRAEIAYRPVIQSFNAGEPRYEVGYMTELGQFEPILINNQPYLLEKNYQTETQANLRFATKNALIVANNAGAPKKDIAIAEINHLATLDHFDEELFLTANPLFMRKFDSLLGREEALKIFRSMKEKYKGSGQ